MPANISNRGPAYLDGTIFRGTVDGRVVALDAKTGKILWDEQYADPKIGESFVAAPIAWKGKVFIGISISDLGIHGRMLAHRRQDGQGNLALLYRPAGQRPYSENLGRRR